MNNATHCTTIHKRLHNMREQCRDVTLSNFVLVAADLEPHVDLNISQLPTELVLLRVLAKPSASKTISFRRARL